MLSLDPTWIPIIQQIAGCVRGTPLHVASVMLQYGLFFMVPFMTIAFLIAAKLRNNGIADIAWGLGFVAIAWAASYDGHFGARTLLLAIMVTIWGTRLALHILARNRGKPEDFRYAEMRKRWGKKALFRSYTRIFLLQGILMLTIAFPIIFVSIESRLTPLNIVDYLGVIVWLIGFAFEATADAQLSAFKKRTTKKGAILDSGLWRYSRHPNYFGEAVQWWGIFLIAVTAPSGWVTIVSPLLITFLLMRVSGVPMLERKMKASPSYRDYIEKTPAFVPWFPKKNRTRGTRVSGK